METKRKSFLLFWEENEADDNSALVIHIIFGCTYVLVDVNASLLLRPLEILFSKVINNNYYQKVLRDIRRR